MSRDLIEYNKSIKSIYKGICEPLNHLGLGFAYTRVFLKNNRYLTLCDNIDYIADCVANLTSSSIHTEDNNPIYNPNEIAFTLWPKDAHCFSTQLHKRNNIWRGMTVSKLSKDHLDLWWFYGAVENSWLTPAFYMKYKDFLERFIEKFNKKAGHLINNTNDLDLGLFKDGMKYSNVFSDQISAKNELEKFLIDISGEELGTLSKQEKSALNLLLQGNSLRSIGLHLDKSYRTVEGYITSAKIKLECENKYELTNKYFNFCCKIIL